MHELSIAMSIVEICTAEAQKAGAGKVTRVEVEIGSMAGIETDALEFSWEAATAGSITEGAPLVILKTEALARCRECSHEFLPENLFSACPACGEYGYELIRGKELQLKAILVE